MTIVLEDGTGRADANSYASVDDLKNHAKARGVTLTQATPVLEGFLLQAMDGMYGLDYKGIKYKRDQALDFPRINVCIDRFSYAHYQLPPQLKIGQCALALEIAQNKTDLLPTTPVGVSGAMVEETIGEITTRWADGGRYNSKPIIAKAQQYLSKLLQSSGSTMRVERG
jgi:hypothetical protein